ncbi:MAG: hypothetical protein M1469_02970 [Bacteroidetes bacterium]|nr:hypothetical protein [Bacteroidota bacterium]
MRFSESSNQGMISASVMFVSAVLILNSINVFAQEPMIGAQNGVTWRSLVIGTEAETVTRKTFYVDGLYNMSVFWSQHASLNADAVNYNDAFMGLNVGEIRNGLDSFYANDKNLQVPIVDAILIVRLQNAQIRKSRVDEIVQELRRATINGINPESENKIWKSALPLLR